AFPIRLSSRLMRRSGLARKAKPTNRHRCRTVNEQVAAPAIDATTTIVAAKADVTNKTRSADASAFRSQEGAFEFRNLKRAFSGEKSDGSCSGANGSDGHGMTGTGIPALPRWFWNYTSISRPCRSPFWRHSSSNLLKALMPGV